MQYQSLIGTKKSSSLFQTQLRQTTFDKQLQTLAGLGGFLSENGIRDKEIHCITNTHTYTKP